MRPAPRAGTTASDLRRIAGYRFGALAVVLFSAALLGPLLGAIAPGGTYAVATGSMEPGIPQHALVLVRPGEPTLGDVIAYHSASGAVQIHRVIEMREAPEGIRYVTKGDALDAPDAHLVAPQQVAGVVAWTIPRAGLPWLVPPALLLAALGGFIAAYLAVTLVELQRMPAGATSRRRPGRAVVPVTATLIVVLLLLPAHAYAAVQGSGTASTTTLTVVDPAPFGYATGNAGNARIVDHGAGAEVHLQGNVPTRDVLRQRSASDSPCTWVVRLSAGPSTFSAIGTVALALRTGTTSLPQVTAVGGILVQASGPNVLVPPGATLEHVLTRHPVTTGTMSVIEDAHCAPHGIRTQTTTTYAFS